MMTLSEAAKAGITKLRKPEWSTASDYMQIDIVDGKHGPWGHLYSIHNQPVNGKNPVDVLLLGMLDEDDWMEHRTDD